jgi:hypothetical protein
MIARLIILYLCGIRMVTMIILSLHVLLVMIYNM